MPQDSPNILSILGVSSKEDVISNLLCYCIEASPAFCSVFLRDICGIDPLGLTNTRAFTRITTGSSGVPDLIVMAESATQKHLVILENKLKADEGKDQTDRYSSPECVQDVKNYVGWPDAVVAEHFIFLTLFPDQEPEANIFQCATYSDLSQAIKGLTKLEDPVAKLLLEAWISLVSQFYLRASISPADVLLAKLQEYDPLEGSYLYFRSFVQDLELGYGLEVEDKFRSSARGRRYFGAVISKPSWHPAEMQEVDGIYHLDAKQNFNIHFEPQFHYLKGTFELYVHYEVNPYRTASWVADNISLDQYDSYNNLRERFIETLRAKGIPDLSIGGGSNQIAKARLTIEDSTVAEARDAIAEIINRVAAHIDDICNDPKSLFA